LCGTNSFDYLTELQRHAPRDGWARSLAVDGLPSLLLPAAVPSDATSVLAGVGH
jgi:hypothetical protein